MIGADFEVSAVFLSGMAKALKADGTFDQVLSRLSPASRDVMREPNLKRWWPSTVLEEILRDGLQRSPEALALLNYTMTKNSLGAIVGPVFQIAMTFSGATPATILNRLNAAVRTGMRTIETEWKPSAPNAGTLVVRYPRPWVATAEHLWKGTLRMVFEFSKANGRIVASRVDASLTTFEFDVAW